MPDSLATQTFREKLAADDLLIGTFLKTPTTHATEILGAVGFDFVVIDAEHAPFDRGDIDRMLLASRASGTAGIVRVPDASPAGILSVLDCGAAGVLVPHVTSAAMARDLVAACRFRGGSRGFSNSTRAGNYGRLGIWEYVDVCDAQASVIAMIEDPEAVDTIEEIVAVDGLDAVFIGRGDLTVAYGAPTPVADEVNNAVLKIIEAAKAAGTAILTVSPGGEDAKRLVDLGVSGLIVASDQGFMAQAAGKCLADLRQLSE